MNIINYKFDHILLKYLKTLIKWMLWISKKKWKNSIIVMDFNVNLGYENNFKHSSILTLPLNQRHRTFRVGWLVTFVLSFYFRMPNLHFELWIGDFAFNRFWKIYHFRKMVSYAISVLGVDARICLTLTSSFILLQFEFTL